MTLYYTKCINYDNSAGKDTDRLTRSYTTEEYNQGRRGGIKTETSTNNGGVRR